MKSKIEEIKNYIWSYIDEDGNVIPGEFFDEITDLIDYANEMFSCNTEIKHVGGFDSPGYDVDCYAWAGIIEGELYFDSLEQTSC